MCTQVHYLIVFTLLVAGCASVDASRLRQMSPAELVQTFGSCVGPYGVHTDVSKLALQEDPESARLERVQLSTSGIVSDGFNHDLLLDRSLGLAYVFETGGFAGVRKWYGPLTLRTGCARGALRGQLVDQHMTGS